ncbi:MAG TPA: hypothetical protein VMG12_29245 [Polyangiaceae bacterium]|nr:hypothetical protein [Polyangiaceae bacterium]
MALLLLAACGGAAAGAGKPSPVTVERLYPLRPGSVWTYDVDTGEGLPVLAITRVLSAEGGKVEVSSGSDGLHYEPRPEGLMRSDVGSYLLRAPLSVGNSWQGQQGAQVEITRVDATASTPAGEFVNCLETVESAGPSEKRVRTVFCPDVGPVEIESSLHIQLTGKSTRVIARLRGYDFSGAAMAAQ